jgi:hypothetical protein
MTTVTLPCEYSIKKKTYRWRINHVDKILKTIQGFPRTSQIHFTIDGVEQKLVTKGNIAYVNCLLYFHNISEVLFSIEGLDFDNTIPKNVTFTYAAV